MTDRRLWLVCLGLSLTVLLATAHWYGLVNIDAQAADWGAWRLARHGTFDLTGAPGLPDNPFFVRSGGHLVSGRTAGVLLIGVPAQFLLAAFNTGPETAGTLTAALTTALGCANTAVLLRRLGSAAEAPVALAAALVLCFGTPLWTVAGAELWTHGPDFLWLSCALLAAQRQAWWWSGLAFSAALWTRPHLALAAAAVAVAASWAGRTPRPTIAVGVTTSVALGGLVVWNDLLYGRASVGGSYAYVADRAGATSGSATRAFADNIVLGTISPLRGFLLYTPVVLPALWCGLRHWRSAPGWTRGALLGGIAYLLLQWHVNDYQGGTNFFGNRLVIETLVLAAPLCYSGYLQERSKAWLRHLTRAAAGLAVATHATGALLAYAPPNSADTQGGAWRRWLLLDDIRSLHGLGWMVFTVVVVASAIVASGVLTRPTDRLLRALG